MTELIRKAVELAEGLLFRDASSWYEIKQNYGEQAFMDALAAQLWRQLTQQQLELLVGAHGWRILIDSENGITAIVESGVLE